MPPRPVIRATLLGAVGTLVAAGGALTLTPAGDPTAGAKVFVSAGCGGCHTLAAARSTGKVGPVLDTLQPSPERVQAQVRTGGGAMPPFAASLTPQQIANVAEYVAQASRGWRPGAVAPTVPSPAPTSPTPVASDRVSVLLTDSRITTRRVLPAGTVTFDVRNVGSRPHQLVILRLRRSARSLPTMDGRVLEVGRVRGVAVPARARRSLRVTLAAGSYVLISNRPGDVARGMALRVQVEGAVAPQGSAAAIPPAEVASPLDAKALFSATCGGCHTLADAGTTGVVGPNLDRRARSADAVARQVRAGEADGSMPSFAGSLTDAQITAIATYVATATGRE